MCDESAANTPFLQMIENGKCTIGFPNSTDAQIFNLAKTELSKSKDAVEIFWSYPVRILTIIIETGYTQEQKAYAIALDAESMENNVTKVYQTLNGQDIQVKANAGKYMLESDSNGQVIVKLHSWPKMTTYGTYIRYQIIQK
jgi:hypothetical protein